MKPLLIALAVSALALPGAAAAQMDWMTPHLESQRSDNLRRHQQRMRAKTAPQAEHRPQARRSSISMAERQAAWSRNKTEYRRRMLRDGPASADRWLDTLVLAQR